MTQKSKVILDKVLMYIQWFLCGLFLLIALQDYL